MPLKFLNKLKTSKSVEEVVDEVIDEDGEEDRRMSFFDSEVVRAEMTEVGQLQQEVYTSMFSFYSMTKEDKIKHIDLLSRLLEKKKFFILG